MALDIDSVLFDDPSGQQMRQRNGFRMDDYNLGNLATKLSV